MLEDLDRSDYSGDSAVCPVANKIKMDLQAQVQVQARQERQDWRKSGNSTSVPMPADEFLGGIG
jgi:hypothetical protein